jgi:hypothetical protein
MNGYEAVIAVARQDPSWLRVIRACLDYPSEEFAGRWILQGLDPRPRTRFESVRGLCKGRAKRSFLFRIYLRIVQLAGEYGALYGAPRFSRCSEPFALAPPTLKDSVLCPICSSLARPTARAVRTLTQAITAEAGKA